MEKKKSVLIIDSYYTTINFLQKNSEFNIIFSSPQKAIKKFIIHKPSAVFLYDETEEGKKTFDSLKELSKEINENIKFATLSFHSSEGKEDHIQLPTFMEAEIKNLLK